MPTAKKLIERPGFTNKTARFGNWFSKYVLEKLVFFGKWLFLSIADKTTN